MLYIFRKYNDIFIYFFGLIFNLSLWSSLNYHITLLKKIKIDNWRVIEVMS